MAQRLCQECHQAIHEGAISCAHCGASAPPLGGSPEALQQLVHKEMDALHPERADEPSLDSPFEAMGELAMNSDSPIDMAMAEFSMAKVDRDANGRVIWDPKLAIVGSIVVAITVGLLVAWILRWF